MQLSCEDRASIRLPPGGREHPRLQRPDMICLCRPLTSRYNANVRDKPNHRCTSQSITAILLSGFLVFCGLSTLGSLWPQSGQPVEPANDSVYQQSDHREKSPEERNTTRLIPAPSAITSAGSDAGTIPAAGFCFLPPPGPCLSAVVPGSRPASARHFFFHGLAKRGPPA